jgi:carboxypeptidase C (cathepsin A)
MHAWEVNGQVAGYAITYDRNFQFTTVRGAGHMVPEDQPERAFFMMSQFLNGKDL